MRPLMIGQMVRMQLSRLGMGRQWYRVLLLGLLSLAMVLGTYLLYWREMSLPIAASMYALITLLGATVMGLQFAGGMALMALSSLTILTLLQAQRLIPADIDWVVDGIQAADILGLLVIFTIMALAAWVASWRVKRSLEQAMKLQQLAEVGKLTTHLLHDLANPITAASLNLAQIKGEGYPPALERAIESIKCLERYVVAARKQTQYQSELQWFKIGTEIQQVMKLLAQKARWQGVTLEASNHVLARVYGDPVKFNHLILNLVDNAIEAYAAAPTSHDRRVSVDVTASNDQVVVTVSDNGCGITRGDQEKIFAQLFSTKRIGGGIGLATARQIAVDDFGGAVTVESLAGTTRFSVTLPAHSDKPPA